MSAWRHLLAAAAGALALLGASAAAQAPDPYARELAAKLARSERAVTQEGYVRAAGPFAGALAPGEARRVTLSLRAGQDYAVIGVCATQCGAPGLRLIDPGGADVAHGAPLPEASVMLVRVPATAQYELEARMLRCADAACWYALNVYTR